MKLENFAKPNTSEGFRGDGCRGEYLCEDNLIRKGPSRMVLSEGFDLVLSHFKGSDQSLESDWWNRIWSLGLGVPLCQKVWKRIAFLFLIHPAMLTGQIPEWSWALYPQGFYLHVHRPLYTTLTPHATITHTAMDAHKTSEGAHEPSGLLALAVRFFVQGCVGFSCFSIKGISNDYFHS